MHKLVMYGFSKQKNLVLVKKWEWLQADRGKAQV